MLDRFFPARESLFNDNRSFFWHAWNGFAWLILLVLMASTVGSACAFFLWSLDIITKFRCAHPWLLYFLPLGGLLLGLLYHRYGASVEGGNNLLLDQIHQPGGGIPKRMTPFVLFGTLITHLFGGSAGREGTAVQMGGSIASTWAHAFKFKNADLRLLLMAGIAAGFGGVFGTPVAGAIFAIEVLAIGKVHWCDILPCLIAAYAGDWACSAWHVHHTHYGVCFPVMPSLIHPDFLFKVIVASAIFGLAGKLFSELAHTVQYAFKRAIPIPSLRPVVGGSFVILLTSLLGTQEYLGLGVTGQHPNAASIVNAFHGHFSPLSWLWKIVFTVITVSSGFKGGEVTPLFFIGATLGNTLAWLFNAPTDLFAALGFIAVFAAAANTSFACVVMGMELFGAEYGLLFGLSCFIAFWSSGHSGIYLSQKITKPKWLTRHSPEESTLRLVHERNLLRTSQFLKRVYSRIFPNSKNIS